MSEAEVEVTSPAFSIPHVANSLLKVEKNFAVKLGGWGGVGADPHVTEPLAPSGIPKSTLKQKNQTRM